jgi:hypothetical protein
MSNSANLLSRPCPAQREHLTAVALSVFSQAAYKNSVMTQGNLLPTLDWFSLHAYFAADGRRDAEMRQW